ncbi:glycosyltransferase family 25 protein [Shimwellia blattae]|uniref:Dethiobiotin synthetase n=1 Tax=Shimwellia blattae (strain ATCC 29907 / DSM 4481 / JCM 1650 / NBRC 105725 / CDC 9005-74) TaxID=630626 RepID=I2BEH2_SHIBC|nr:glycosyltransferase family 25 protein [Shimwellia blattae]AFJ48926.1 dethiobiotin synthetase [Shimwellia blattae DSM 4481 = NBRC 105725]GAB81802.1 putative galactosyltransferase [Shimwellia blattae DSM 4481 = NBRC 105725]VDY66411.1 Glycosyltransferase family 25 (LPS biosynthesis protein) [Shimwellia blattae]VEC28142.1 Glycosyltransferase family 25 (LPS biosynthesis protein) [Shimwellia blattae]
MSIPVYVVSLKRDVARRDKICADFAAIGVEFEFFDAVDAKSPERYQVIQQARSTGRGSVMSDGEIACALSHQYLYQKLLDEGHDWVVVLEDDVIVDRRFKQFIDQISAASLAHLDKQDLVLLGGQKGLHDYPVLGLSLLSYQRLGGFTFRRVNYNEKKIRRTCCYMMNAVMAASIVDFTASYGIYHADSWKLLSQHGLINNYFLNEMIIHPKVNATNSHLEQERIESAGDKEERSAVNRNLKIARSWMRVFCSSFFK